MVNQKAISAKIHWLTYEELEKEAMASGYPKNRILNFAIMAYIRLEDAKRACRCYGTSDVTKEVIEAYINREFRTCGVEVTVKSIYF